MAYKQWGVAKAARNVTITLPVAFIQPFNAVVSSYFTQVSSDYTEAITDLTNTQLTISMDPNGQLGASQVWFIAMGV